MTIAASEITVSDRRRPVLSDDEIEHFALQGYVVKKNVLDPAMMDRAVDVMWEMMPARLDRHDPATWRGELTDCRGTLSISARYGKVKLRAEIWENRTIDDLIAGNEDIFGMVEQLLGRGRVVRPERVRGLYPIFPTPEHRNVPVDAHVDVTKTPFKVSVAAYLRDVPPQGGGLTVWPGSHRTLFYDCTTTASSSENLEARAFRRHFASINRTAPVEITGEAGDVVIFHYCLMHAAGINAVGGHVRQAIFCNYRTKDCGDGMPAPRPEGLWDGWDGISALDSPAIRESARIPADPALGRRAVGGRALRIYVEKARRRLLRRFG